MEDLSVTAMRMKSRAMNRKLRTSQLGYLKDKLQFKLVERGIAYQAVPSAYTSQQCSRCGFTLGYNRRSQAQFVCAWCGHTQNADENAARNIAERFGDDQLSALPFRDVLSLLITRFMSKLWDARSASPGPDASIGELTALWRPGSGPSARVKPWLQRDW